MEDDLLVLSGVSQRWKRRYVILSANTVYEFRSNRARSRLRLLAETELARTTTVIMLRQQQLWRETAFRQCPYCICFNPLWEKSCCHFWDFESMFESGIMENVLMASCNSFNACIYSPMKQAAIGSGENLYQLSYNFSINS